MVSLAWFFWNKVSVAPIIFPFGYRSKALGKLYKPTQARPYSRCQTKLLGDRTENFQPHAKGKKSVFCEKSIRRIKFFSPFGYRSKALGKLYKPAQARPYSHCRTKLLDDRTENFQPHARAKNRFFGKKASIAPNFFPHLGIIRKRLRSATTYIKFVYKLLVAKKLW